MLELETTRPMSAYKRCCAISIRMIGSSVWAFCIVNTGAFAGPPAWENMCEDLSGHRRFVEATGRLAQEALDDETVLETLLCIYKRPDAQERVRLGALNAYMHIIGNDVEVRRFLLSQVDEMDREHGQCHSLACSYLMFFADAEVRTRLLQLLQKYPYRCGSAYSTLKTLGDEGLAVWLEEMAASSQETVNAKESMLEQVAFIRSQRSTEKLIQFCHSDRRHVSDYEFEIVAVRLGVPVAQLRDCYVQKIDLLEAAQPGRKGHRTYVRSLLERGILTEADLDALPAVFRDVRRRVDDDDLSVHEPWPRWATYLDEKKKAFWNPPSTVNKEKRGGE